jgi:hypothetical protein
VHEDGGQRRDKSNELHKRLLFGLLRLLASRPPGLDGVDGDLAATLGSQAFGSPIGQRRRCGLSAIVRWYSGFSVVGSFEPPQA